MKKSGILVTILLVVSGAAVFYFIFKFFKKTKNLDKYLAKVNLEREDISNAIENATENIRDAVEERVPELSVPLRKVEKKIRANVKKKVASVEKKIEKKIAKIEKSAQKIAGANDRQNNILSIIKDKRKLNMTELAQNFKEVTQRTLRRDMEKLESLGIVKQVGRTRDSHYEIVKF